jgi:hypothetical protein
MSRHYRIADLRPHAELDRLLPEQSADEYDAMKADIAASRIFQPLVICKDGDGYVVIDGRHRLRAAQELGLSEVPCTLIDGLGEDERIERGIALNVRRNLTADQKRDLAADLLRRWPAKSDRALAALCGLSHPTVAAVRARLVGAGQLESLSSREGKDGRTRPAAQRRTPAPDNVPAELRKLAVLENELVYRIRKQVGGVVVYPSSAEWLYGFCRDAHGNMTHLAVLWAAEPSPCGYFHVGSYGSDASTVEYTKKPVTTLGIVPCFDRMLFDWRSAEWFHGPAPGTCWPWNEGTVSGRGQTDDPAQAGVA